MAIVAEASARFGGMFCVLDQLRRSCKLLVTLSACGIGFHLLRELTSRISAVHFVARRAGDSLTGLACAKTFRACHSLILVRGKSRRAVVPETWRKTKGADLVFTAYRPVELEQILSGVIRIAFAHHWSD